jgi:hypothetical protein
MLRFLKNIEEISAYLHSLGLACDKHIFLSFKVFSLYVLLLVQWKVIGMMYLINIAT